MNRLEKWMAAARRVWAFIWKECAAFRAPYYSWHPEMPCVHIITTLNWAFFFSLFSFHHHHHPQVFLFFFFPPLGWGGGCVIKRSPVLVRGPGVMVSDALSKATLCGWAVKLRARVSWSVLVLRWGSTEVSVPQREWKHDDLISSPCLSSTLLPGFYSLEHQRVCEEHRQFQPFTSSTTKLKWVLKDNL